MLFAGTSVVQAQYYNKNARVVAQNYDISDNLDLQAVASIFGESRDLEDFERKLNDPSIQISNLDLNNDQYVDYLRVIEVAADSETRIIVIQAVLGQDMFQDVATIELEKRNSRNTRSSTVYVQVVGNPYLYGPNYIYEPYYWYRPTFFDILWAPGYNLYYSPWYWGYYPSYYSYWRPMPVFRYRRHITPVINTRNRYVYADRRNISSARNIYSSVSRNSYADRNPGRSFVDRNRQVTNRRELVNNRQEITRNLGNSVDRNTGRGIINSDRNTRNSNIRSTDLRSSGTRDFDSSRSRLIQDRSRDREIARDLKTREVGRIQRAEDSKREQVRIQRSELNTRRAQEINRRDRMRQERTQAIERSTQTRNRSYNNSRSNSSRNFTRSTSSPSRSFSSPSRSISTSSSRGSSSGRTISR